MAKTARQLIREIAARQGELIVCTPEAGGQTALHCPDLLMYFPQQIQQFNGWVYGAGDVDAQNKGIERRGQSWTIDGTLSLYAPGFPAAITGGEYEIHMRYPRARVTEALNAAIGQLGLNWFREWQDDSIITRADTWRYVLPASENWANVNRIEIQINLAETQIGYPYADAEYLNWRPRKWTNNLGVETWVIEFGLLPPPDRKLRVFGEQYFTDVLTDDDILAIGGKWERAALDWLYDYAEFRLQWWLTNRQPTAEADKLRQQALDRLENQKNEILQNAPSHKPGRIVTPGHGDAMAFPSPEDWRYLGAFKSSSFIRGG
ncbi:MAG TPA: hypothetical protein VGJ60_20435 [Chloroflexota bacterium]